MYDAYADLAARYPHITVVVGALPDDTMGSWDGNTLTLNANLTPDERNSTLAHEIVHLDRGMPDDHPDEIAAEELIVDDIASRRLIESDDLALVIGITLRRNATQIAEELGVDAMTVVSRISNLSLSELSELSRKAQKVFGATDNNVIPLPVTA